MYVMIKDKDGNLCCGDTDVFATIGEEIKIDMPTADGDWVSVTGVVVQTL